MRRIKERFEMASKELQLVIRPYGIQDRHAVRWISYETAHRGSPGDVLFKDREIIADLLTRYYTDYEAHSLWVAEYEGRVIGYLTGCLDSNRYRRIMLGKVMPRIFIRAIFCGAFFRLETWGWIAVFLRTVLKKERPSAHFFKEYPAHFHVNVDQHFRGRLVGQRLIALFFRQLQEVGIQAVHLTTRKDNLVACRFFEHLGFSQLKCYPTSFLEGNTLVTYETVVYGKKL